MTTKEIDALFAKICDLAEEDAFKFADKLAKHGGDYVMKRALELLYAEEQETKDLAARILKNMEDNQAALEPLFAAIWDKKNKNRHGMMVDALEGFDVSEKFVDILRLYLFGNFKVSAHAKMLLNFQEFNITPRVLRKSQKHWKHYSNNAKHDEAFEAKQLEVASIFQDLKELLES